MLAVQTLPLWLVGVAVAVVGYLALAYLAVAGARTLVAMASVRGRRSRALQRAGEVYDIEAHPTLLEVAAARAQHIAAERAGESRRAA